MSFFGSPFDFDFDGHTDREEELFGLFMMHQSVQNQMLEEAGLDPDELSVMDGYERDLLLRSCGLDPDDFMF